MMSGVIYLANLMLIRIDITFGPTPITGDNNHNCLPGPPPPPFLRDDDQSDSESFDSDFRTGSDCSGFGWQCDDDTNDESHSGSGGEDVSATPANSPVVPPSTSSDSDSDIEIIFRPIPLGASFFGARNQGN